MQTARVFANVADAVSDCSLVLGTTAGQHRVPQQIVERLESGMMGARRHLAEGQEDGRRVAILFGSEKFGLSNEDMSFCHGLVRIVTSPETPSMNLGQAVAVCLYELVRAEGEPEAGALPVHPVPAVSGNDAEQISRMLLEVLEKSGYTNRIVAVSTEQKIRRWIRRLRISRRDAPLLLGILRQILWKFDKRP